MSWNPHLAGRALVLVLLIIGITPRPALAASDYERYLSAAISLYEDLEYERALRQIERAKKAASGITQDVTLALHEGVILADMGRWEKARAAFRTALALDVEAQLPLRVSPKVRREFDMQRIRVKRELAKRKKGQVGAPVSPPESAAPAEPAPVAAPAPAEPAPVVVAAAPVVATDRPEQPPAPKLVPEAPPPSPLDPTVEAPRVRSLTVPLVLLGAGVAAASAGAYFGMDSRGQVTAARDAAHQDEALSHLEDARGSAKLANILFGTAGLAACGALISYLVTPGEPASTVEESP
ncbi:tetratricopeptide repeat protein [Myxococcaceae bacterium GXIMD 01537]